MMYTLTRRKTLATGFIYLFNTVQYLSLSLELTLEAG